MLLDPLRAERKKKACVLWQSTSLPPLPESPSQIIVAGWV